jgi:hypothetical protein
MHSLYAFRDKLIPRGNSNGRVKIASKTYLANAGLECNDQAKNKERVLFHAAKKLGQFSREFQLIRMNLVPE